VADDVQGAVSHYDLKFFQGDKPMRGWIILHSLTASIGIASAAASGGPAPGVSLGLSAVGVTLLALAIGARLVRGRA